MPSDVLATGRVGVDVYPLQRGVGLAEVTSFGKHPGGSPTNVAVAAARHGHSAAVITKTGRDPFGDLVRSALDGYGVDSRLAGTSDIAPTPVTFCEIFPPGRLPAALPPAPEGVRPGHPAGGAGPGRRPRRANPPRAGRGRGSRSPPVPTSRRPADRHTAQLLITVIAPPSQFRRRKQP